MQLDGPDGPNPILAELEPGERLVWHGAPRRGLRFRRAHLTSVPAILGLLGIGAVALWDSHYHPNPRTTILGPTFGVSFVLLGLYLVFGPPLSDAWLRRRTRYALTDRRAVIAASWLGPAELRSYRYEDFGQWALEENPDGSGTIFLPMGGRRNGGGAAFTTPGGRGLSKNWRTAVLSQFDLIDDVRTVAGLINRLLADARTARSDRSDPNTPTDRSGQNS